LPSESKEKKQAIEGHQSWHMPCLAHHSKPVLHLRGRMNRKLLLSFVPVSVGIFFSACGQLNNESKIAQSISVPRGDYYSCTRTETDEVGKLDPGFCGFDEGGFPGQRIYRQGRGYDCVKTTYDNNGNLVSKTNVSYRLLWEEATLQCSNSTFRKQPHEEE
jgi:hypothetical protein